MGEFKLLLPKMGESVIEATVLQWHKAVGDKVDEDEIIVEVATDKVDTEVPSPVSGVVKELLADEGDVVAVGAAMALIEVEGEVEQKLDIVEAIEETPSEEVVEVDNSVVKEVEKEIEITTEIVKEVEKPLAAVKVNPPKAKSSSKVSERFYSPLVSNIAKTEGISKTELDAIPGTGKDGRLTKHDILNYLKTRSDKPASKRTSASVTSNTSSNDEASNTIVSPASNEEIIEMDRMRKLIADHMVNSKKTSAHVSSFVEADLTEVAEWRDKHKDAFLKREGFKLSFMPIFVDAIVKAIKEFPMINVSVDGNKIIKKKRINIGIATALPSGNLIVPVIKDADQMNLNGIAHRLNDLVTRARNNQLQSDDIDGGTYTISNIGTFGNILGTPIINQPQVAIMAVGSITKKPVVIESSAGDVIGIRHMMYLSHTYDHRVVDGMLGGLFVQRVGQLLENFDVNREV